MKKYNKNYQIFIKDVEKIRFRNEKRAACIVR